MFLVKVCKVVNSSVLVKVLVSPRRDHCMLPGGMSIDYKKSCNSGTTTLIELVLSALESVLLGLSLESVTRGLQNLDFSPSVDQILR